MFYCLYDDIVVILRVKNIKAVEHMLGYILIVMLVYIGIQIIIYDRSYKKAMIKI